MLDKGQENRAVTATEMNAESSRSHAVLVARVTREKRETKERSMAKLFLVDLAGSERISKVKKIFLIILVNYSFKLLSLVFFSHYNYHPFLNDL